jgi:cobalt-zinc-cadmium efflux system outer membrane protein
MRNLRLIFSLLGLSLLPFPAAAQEGAVTQLTIEGAVKFGLEHNQNLAADREQIAAARGRQRQAGLKANPMIESAGLASVNDTGMQNLSVGVTLPLEVGRRERRVTLAEREVERMRHEVADRERMLAAEIRLKFAELLETRQNLALLTGIVELNREIRLLVGARVAEGVSPRLEENMQLVELRRSEAQVESAASRLRVLTEELRGLIGLPEGTALEVAGDLPTTGTDAAKVRGDEVSAVARQRRPDLHAALAAEEMGEAMIAMARTEGRFDLSVFGEFGWQRWRFDQSGQMDGRLVPVGMRSGMIRGGVNIMLPVRNRNQGNIEAAVALRQEARRRREFIESIITREVAAALAKLDGATRVLQRFDDQLIETQEKSLQITRASFELGHARLNDVLAEQRRLIELKMEQNMARRELLLARIELSRATNE